MKRGMKSRSVGFTLIELLVVISVIGILAGIALISFSGAQKQARDSQRKSDVKQYQNSVEVFGNNNNGLFPSRTSAVAASSTLCTDVGLSSCPGPEDPRNSEDPTQEYRYQSNGSGSGAVDATDYVLWAKIEARTTTTYWVNCSSGLVGETTTGIPPTGGTCPL